MTQTSTPKTIANLTAEIEAIGGKVEQFADRKFAFHFPMRTASGVRTVQRAMLGYYVREDDGKNVIRGNMTVAEIRREIAYWGKQTGGR